ncbi:MAG TPA: FecR domain-containing protein [Longimicrobiales bacterium]|nr:FecR domain-containing protein [Longimicrobiales bacterium]
MDELIIRVLTEDATPDEERQLRRWRGEAPENEAHFQGLRQLWDLTSVDGPRTPRTPPDARVIVQAAEARRRERGLPSSGSVRSAERASRIPWSRRWGLALAATLAVLAVGIGVLRQSGGPALPGGSFEAEFTGPRTVALEDGSLVRLADGARLARSTDADVRGIRLEGRAFFAVARDEARPFLVRTAAGDARVLGTRFELESAAGSLRAVVVEGRLAVSNESGRAVVQAGSVGRAEAGSPPTAEPSDDVYALLDWPGGVLLFQATPLEQVASEVGRQFGREVEVRGEALPALRISGSFESMAFEEVVGALCEVAGVECEVTPDGAVIGPGPGA